MPYGVLNIIFLIALALLPSLIWLAYFLKRDERPEPRLRLIITFCAGSLITFGVAYGEKLLGNWSNLFKNEDFKKIIFFLVFPLLEEIGKFSAVLISNFKNRYFRDEYLDPIIYCVTAALGFASAENLKVCLSILEENAISFSSYLLANLTIPFVVINTLIITIFIRLLSAVFLHANTASVYGYFWGVGRILKKRKHIQVYLIFLGMIIASLLHSCYNYLILKTTENINFVVGIILLLLITNYIMSRAFKQLKSYQ